MNKEYLHSSGRPYTENEFMGKLKTNFNFNKKFGKKKTIDQIFNLIEELRTNPDSRRLLVSAWSVDNIDSMILPPCHYGFQCYTYEMTKNERILEYKKSYPNDRILNVEYLDSVNFPKRKLSLKWNQRSCDFPLGIPMNISSYGLLLKILSNIVNMIPDELIGSFGDCHIYTNQVDGVKEQLNRNPLDLPSMIFSDNIDFTSIGTFLNTCKKNDITLDNYNSHSKIYFPLSN